MPDSSPSPQPRAGRWGVKRDRSWTISLIGSYVFDWIVLLAVAAVGGVLAIIEPNKRHFSLLDPNIAFPYTVKETVPLWMLCVLVGAVPILVIVVVCLIFVPGNTVPKGTPAALLWKRKLWELHAGLIGLALSLVGAWFITNGMKNMFGRPRPDMLSRCQPDLANFRKFVVGGIAQEDIPTELNQILTVGMLVSADICQQTDSYKLDEGFRSYPSGHSSGSSAGLIYLSLFLASKFAVTIPFVASSAKVDHTSFSAFPSRIAESRANSGEAEQFYQHQKALTSIRRQAAAPPIYLLAIMVLPTFLSVFIAGSRWFDFRHHAFDILFGYLIGVITAVFGFYWYHLPIRSGAGWAWGPRSHDKAWWSGVGSNSYATDRDDYLMKRGDEEEALRGNAALASSAQVEEHKEERRRPGAGSGNGSMRSGDDLGGQGADTREFYRDHSNGPAQTPGSRQGDDQFAPYSAYNSRTYGQQDQEDPYDRNYNAR